jgi:molybdopterin-guanine dinucleotide biosynthesis protein A
MSTLEMSTQEMSTAINILGVVACGGKSSRMGTDKSMLQYHGQPQRYVAYTLMETFCDKVVLSVNEQQACTVDPVYSFMIDLPIYSHAGPITALLTAFETFPGSAVFLLGCDYPLLQEQTVQQFISICRKENRLAAFYNQPADLYEPLLGYYPAKTASLLTERHSRGQHSLQQFLREQQAVRFIPENAREITSADDPEKYSTIKAELAGFKKYSF